ncbi:MAG: alpha/beta hydrolase [Gemmatimonadales bacterium]
MKPTRETRTLEFDLSPASLASERTTLAVLLHGRGSDKADLQGLRPQLPPDWTLVTPRAPFPGEPWGYGKGYAWYRYVEEDRLDADTLAESLSLLDTLLGELPRAIGFTPDRTVLGGFSQGGTTSLSYAITRPGRIAAALNFSGFLPASIAVDESGGNPPTTPVFWGHGLGDPAIPFGLAERGRNRLRRAGATLVTRDFSIGHWIVPEEVQAAVEMVDGRR